MRVEFLQRVDVDMREAPIEAYPQITTRTGDKGQIVYCFRRGACPELPEELALQYIEAGLARCTDRTFPATQSKAEILQDAPPR